MATINLSWTPAGGPTSISQTVQRKQASSTTWNDLATGLAPTASTYSDTTAAENTLYDYRIVNVCSAGGPSPGTPSQADKIVCSTITLDNPQTGEQDTIDWTVAATSNDVTIDRVEIIKDGNILETTNVGNAGPASGTYDTGLDFGATYTVRSVLTDGVFTLNCESTIQIGGSPTCGSPTNLTATPV